MLQGLVPFGTLLRNQIIKVITEKLSLPGASRKQCVIFQINICLFGFFYKQKNRPEFFFQLK